MSNKNNDFDDIFEYGHKHEKKHKSYNNQHDNPFKKMHSNSKHENILEPFLIKLRDNPSLKYMLIIAAIILIILLIVIVILIFPMLPKLFNLINIDGIKGIISAIEKIIK